MRFLQQSACYDFRQESNLKQLSVRPPYITKTGLKKSTE